MHLLLERINLGPSFQEQYEMKAEFAHLLKVSGWFEYLEECTAVANAGNSLRSIGVMYL